MSRKSSPEIDQEPVASTPPGPEDADLHGFWDGPTLDLEGLDAAFTADDDLDERPDRARETLVYMGSIPQTQVEDRELIALAEWADSKACRICRTAISEHHELAPLEHEGCRTALRVGSLLRRRP